jgi:dedicated sortase system histidine kinase
MKLRNQLLALSALTLLLPWSGWKLLQELEHFLRESQENTLLASARSLAGSLPLEFQSRLLFTPDLNLLLREFERPPNLDGYADDWRDSGEGLEFHSQDGNLKTTLLAGSFEGQLYLLLSVNDQTPMHALPGATEADGVHLLARNPRGLFSFSIKPEAPGPLRLYDDAEDAGQVEGYWLDTDNGYRLELSLPSAAENSAVSYTVTDVVNGSSGRLPRMAGPLDDGTSRQWISMGSRWHGLSTWFAQSAPGPTRKLLLDLQGRVLADSGDVILADARETTWLQRLLYRVVAGSRTEWVDEWSENPFRIDDPAVQQALSGEEAVSWYQDVDTAAVRNVVAVPLRLEGKIMGAMVVQSASEGLLLVTNRALSRLLLTTLALTFGLAAGLWYFATRLSTRVRRLSGAVSLAMEGGVTSNTLPLVSDHDELGELARNNDTLLRAVAEYNQYLQTLAGKLSHELNTPLAITRSSLDNLASQELSSTARAYLDRACEGLDRQSAIVRAMSEASRLEASIAVAEWGETDLGKLLGNCLEAYSHVYSGRKLLSDIPSGPAPLNCAPDLLAQALDKLIENAMSLSGQDDSVTLALTRNQGHYLIAVRNTGTRLPDEFQDRLFDSLVSVRDRRGSAPHLGLGLYIVRLVAAAHNGTVEARNLPSDGGVEFVIRLPATTT